MTINNQIIIRQNGKTICLYANKYGDFTKLGKKLIKLMHSKELMNKNAADVMAYLKTKFKSLVDAPIAKKVDFIYNINLFDDQNTLVCEFNDPKKKQVYPLFGLAMDMNWEEFVHYQMVGIPYMW